MADDAASAHGVPGALLKGLVTVESAWNPNAIRQEVAIGDASRGLTQVLFSTAQGEGFGGAAEDLFDPATNLDVGASYLARQYRRFGSWDAALAAYNGGGSAGVKVTVPTTVVLARDQVTGAPIRTFVAQPGQYRTQPYVDSVNAAASAYGYVTGGLGGALGLVAILALGGALFMRWRQGGGA
jgi:soluble lytic murein transglycosylase-like protein